MNKLNLKILLFSLVTMFFQSAIIVQVAGYDVTPFYEEADIDVRSLLGLLSDIETEKILTREIRDIGIIHST